MLGRKKNNHHSCRDVSPELRGAGFWVMECELISSDFVGSISGLYNRDVPASRVTR